MKRWQKSVFHTAKEVWLFTFPYRGHQPFYTFLDFTFFIKRFNATDP